MDIALWVAAGLLAAISAGAGVNKLVNSREKLLENPLMGWAGDFTQTQIRLVAVAELAGAIGVILPEAADVAPVLTPLAASGLAVLQLGALRTHALRREWQVVALNLFIVALAVFVAVGRFAGWGD